MKKRIALIAAAALMVLSAMPGCSKPSGTTSETQSKASEQKAVITWMHHVQEESGVQYMKKSTEAFTKKNPNITFELTMVPQDNYPTLLKSKLAAGDAPDMFDVDLDQNPGFIKSGYVYDMSKQPWLHNFITEPPAGPDGKVYAIPTSIAFFGVFYNKDVFKTAGISSTPTTWSEFQQDCSKLKSKGIIPIASGYKDLWTMTCSFHADKMTAIAPNYEDWTKQLEDRKVTWANNPKADMNSVLKRQAYVYDNSQKDPFGTTWDAAQDLVVTGKAAMIINGSWTPGNLETKDSKINVGMFPFPSSEDASKNVFAINGNAKTKANAYYGMGQCVYSKSKNVDAVMKYMAFRATVEDGNLYQQYAKQLSAVKGCSSDFDPSYKEWFDAQKNGLVADIGAFRRDYSGQLDTAYNNTMTNFLMSKDRNAAATLKSLDAQFDKIANLNK